MLTKALSLNDIDDFERLNFYLGCCYEKLSKFQTAIEYFTLSKFDNYQEKIKLCEKNIKEE